MRNLKAIEKRNICPVGQHKPRLHFALVDFVPSQRVKGGGPSLAELLNVVPRRGGKGSVIWTPSPELTGRRQLPSGALDMFPLFPPFPVDFLAKQEDLLEETVPHAPFL